MKEKLWLLLLLVTRLVKMEWCINQIRESGIRGFLDPALSHRICPAAATPHMNRNHFWDLEFL